MLTNILKNIPKSHWIYQFLDKNNKIIYIWKSVNLKARVNSYFNWTSKLNFAKKRMVKQIKEIKTILTNNETESLILETTLIKKHQPKYNILMKDDKNHLYLKITNEIIPRIIKTRISPSTHNFNKKNLNETYFWPYISTNSVNNILKFIRKHFTYRSCNLIFEHPSPPPTPLLGKEGELKGVVIKSTNWTKIPCMDYYIKRCSWPCILKKENIEKYLSNIENIKNFLKWDTKKIVEDLTTQMQQSAKKLNFEKAKEIKTTIDSINTLQENQIVRDLVKWDYEIINHIEKYEKIFIWHIKIRNSKIEWFFNYEIKNKLEEDIENILKIFIERLYAENIENKKNIKFIVSKEIWVENEELKKIIEFPKIGPKIELLKLCYKNTYEYAYKNYLNSLSTKWFSKKTMENLLEILWFSPINKNIIFECNDISHFSWTHTVASRSVIENWKTANSKYRKFKIKTLEPWKIDDFSSLKEIIERRIKEIIKTQILPDLIIIDWWKWQLSSVNQILENYKKDYEILKKLQICSIAKKEEEIFIIKKSIPSPLHFEVLPLKKEEIQSYNFKKIVLEKDSPELKLTQKIRDEAHRFAIEFNRNQRIKSMKKNILEDLPWFWPKTRKKILNEYWSVDNLLKANKENLSKILTKTQIETLENHSLI